MSREVRTVAQWKIEARSTMLALLLAASMLSLLAACAATAGPEPVTAAAGLTVQPKVPGEVRGGAHKRPPAALRPRSVDPGGIAVVVIDDPTVDPANASARLAGSRPITFFAGADRRPRALVGVDLATRPGAYPLLVQLHCACHQGDPGSTRVNLTLTVRRKDFPRENLRVEHKYVEPDKRTLARIRREQERLDAILAKPVPRRLWQGAFLVPVESNLGSPFGLRRFFNGQERRPHAGQDLRAPEGTPVVAAQAGKVVLAAPHFFSGNTIVLDHGLGLFTFYFHLASFQVREGAVVERGALLGRSGKTGRVTGPHLHWAARLNGARVDPLLLTKDLVAEETLNASEGRR